MEREKGMAPALIDQKLKFHAAGRLCVVLEFPN